MPGADENLSISNSEIARRIRLSPDLQGKHESVIAQHVAEALAEQHRRKLTDPAAQAKMADYRRSGASETTMSPLARAGASETSNLIRAIISLNFWKITDLIWFYCVVCV